MEFDLSQFSQLTHHGKGCRIVVFDEAQRNQVRRVDSSINASEHVRRITGFLQQAELHGFARESEIYSVSFHDCFQHGYHTTKKEIVAQYGTIHIEAHAYSCPTHGPISDYERQFADNMRDPSLRSLILCSPGHDDFRVRFPATCNSVLTIGLIHSDGSLLGAGLGDLLPPSFVLTDAAFPALDDRGELIEIRGTSPAVTFVAGISAIIFEKLYGNEAAKFESAQLHAALLLLCDPYRKSYLLCSFSILQQKISACSLSAQSGRQRSLRLRLTRNTETRCRIGIVASAIQAPALGLNHEFPLRIKAEFGDRSSEVEANRAVLSFDDIAVNSIVEINLYIEGLSNEVHLAWSGAELEVLAEEIIPIKRVDEKAIIGISASHDASAVLVVGEKIVAGVQLERLTRIKHDGFSRLSHDEAISYCLAAGGLKTSDIDIFAFNIQALTPGYIGLSQPIAQRDFCSFDPFGPKALFVSHHLCHALAGYSGSHFKQATVVVADGSGGVTVGADDLILDGPAFHEYVQRDKSDGDLRLHTFSVYEFDTNGYSLIFREYSSSFNVRSGSASLGETYAAVSQFVFGSWQSSGKLMGLAPYGKATLVDTYLQRDIHGALNFSSKWKMAVDLYRKDDDVLRYADLAARVQLDLETALIDRFQRHVGPAKNIVFSGGIALNSVANYRLRTDIQPRNLYLLPAQHDAGVAIGAAAAAIMKTSGQIPSSLFEHDFLGYIYTERDVALAINQFADRLQVSRISPEEIALRIAAGKVFGFFSLQKGSEFGPRALGARSILADPRKRTVWTFVNKWIKYREEFRPFAPMVAEESLKDFFEADGHFPYMLEVVQVREECREQLAGITHVDGSARVQTITQKDNDEIYTLLKAFERISGFPILLNTSFNVRGQPMVEHPSHALEMLLSTQLSGVIFGDLLVEVKQFDTDLELHDKVKFSPGSRLRLDCDTQGVQGVLQIQNQGKKIKITRNMCGVLQALAEGNTAGIALARAPISEQSTLHQQLQRYCRLRFLNRQISRGAW